MSEELTRAILVAQCVANIEALETTIRSGTSDTPHLVARDLEINRIALSMLRERGIQSAEPVADVEDDELDQMIWKLERDGGMAPKMLSLMRELRERRKDAGEPVAFLYSASFGRGHVEGEMTDAPGCDMPVYAAPPSPELPEMEQKAIAAVATLNRLGYSWKGGVLWKPPLGRVPSFITDD